MSRINAQQSSTTAFSLPSDLRGIYYHAREKWWLPACMILLAGLAAMIFVERSPKVYAATTTIEIEQEEDKRVKDDGRVIERSAAEEALKTTEEKLKSPALLLRLAKHPDLAHDPQFLPEFKERNSDIRLQAALAGKISAEIRRGTRLIDITVEDTSAEMAQKMANLLVREFIQSSFEDRVAVVRGAHQFLREEAERLKATLARSETALQEYREEHQAISLEEKHNIVVERLKEINSRIATAQADRLRLEAERAQLQRLAQEPPEKLLILSSISSAPEVADLKRRLDDKQAEIATLSRRYRAEHPRYLQAATEQQELQAALNQAILKAAGMAATACEAAQATEDNLVAALRDQERLAVQLSNIAIPYNALTREVESDRALYEALLARLKQTDVAQGVSTYATRIEAPAMLPEHPIRPNKQFILLLSVLGGMVCALTTVLGTYTLDSSLRTVDAAEQTLGCRVAGAIPKRPRTTLAQARRLMAGRQPSPVAEAFRTLRAEILIAGQESERRTLLFASALPGEGKSFCAMNFAASLAQQGYRTLLIDADMRLASTSQVFFGEEPLTGLTDILRGKCDFHQAPQLTDLENLHVLHAGTRTSSIAELVGRSPIREFLSDALKRFDRIVIDTAPVHAVSETHFLASQVDGVLLVIRAGRTPAKSVLRAMEKLREGGANILGLVLNGLPTRGSNYYHYQAPGYGRDEVYGAHTAARG